MNMRQLLLTATKYTFTFLITSTVLLIGCCGSETTIRSGNEFNQIELPDNSVILLNRNTTITYNNSFEPREIWLDGEAFFSVTKGSPFIIKTDQGQVTVIGTEFNVNATKNEIEVEVEDGIVELKKVGKEIKKEIKAGEKAITKTSKDLIEKGKAEFKHNKWIDELKVEFKSLKKEIKIASKGARKEIKKASKEVKKESKELKKEIKKSINKIKN